jgi:hypothetical protein
MSEPGEVFKVPPLGEPDSEKGRMYCGMDSMSALTAAFIRRCEGLSFTYDEYHFHSSDGPVEVEASSIIHEHSKEGSRLLIGDGQQPEE